MRLHGWTCAICVEFDLIYSEDTGCNKTNIRVYNLIYI